MTGCRKYDERTIQGYLDRSLPHGERVVFERHLEGCGSCRRELSAYSILYAGLGHMPLEEPSDGFNARVLGKIRVPAVEKAPAGRRFATLRPWLVLAGVLTPISALALYWIVADSGRISHALSSGFLDAIGVMKGLSIVSVDGMVELVALIADLPIMSAILAVGKILVNATTTTASDPAFALLVTALTIISLLSSLAMARLVRANRVPSGGAGVARPLYL